MGSVFLGGLDQSTVITVIHIFVTVRQFVAQDLGRGYILFYFLCVDFPVLTYKMLILIQILCLNLLFLSFLSVLFKILLSHLIFVLMHVLLLILNIPEILLHVPCLLLFYGLLCGMALLNPLPTLYLIARGILLPRILENIGSAVKTLQLRSYRSVILLLDLILLDLMSSSWHEHLLHIIHSNCYYNYI